MQVSLNYPLSFELPVEFLGRQKAGKKSLGLEGKKER